MSQLYPQWIDVAKLIEPLYQHKQHQLLDLRNQSESLDESDCALSDANATTTTGDSSNVSSNTLNETNRERISGITCCASRLVSSPSSLSSPLTDSSSSSSSSPTGRPNGPPADAELASQAQRSSCVFSVSSSDLIASRDSKTNVQQRRLNQAEARMVKSGPSQSAGGSFDQGEMSAFALSERRSECLRIVRQLLDTLNEPNLIVLRPFICVLRRIADNSEQNKMSASNLGVCVGQSLLNYEHQQGSGGKSGHSTSMVSNFRKRHRRTRSQCILSSLSSYNSSSSSQLNSSANCLESNLAQVSLQANLTKIYCRPYLRRRPLG